ncbi:MAG: hypothetical protein KJ049_11420 [Gammaproteobacteria bacterium]|nr:hypothetical protein [Gammaproteobacteria bacterium]
MTDKVKETLLGAFRQLLRPLIRILLRNGVSYGEYAETAKKVFVEVATRDLVTAKEKPTSSRLAILTGLTRNEVERITQDIAYSRTPSTANLNRIGRMLAGWHQDPEFTGPYGLPLELSITSSGTSFQTLHQRYGGDISAKEMLEELERIGAVIIVASNRVRVLTRSYIPAEADPAAMQFMGVALRDLAETLDFNLNPNIEGGFFERRVWTPLGIDPVDIPEFDKLVQKLGQQFLEALDNHLTAKETDAEAMAPSEKVRVGVGVYMFSDANRQFENE